MQNSFENLESSVDSSELKLNASFETLAPFCQWVIRSAKVQIPSMCIHLRNMTQYVGFSGTDPDSETSYVIHRHKSLYGDAIEHSFAAGSGVIGTLGCVLLILVIIALVSCFKEHRRIQVNGA